MFLFVRLKIEKNKNMIRMFWGSKWVVNKNIEARKKIRRSYKKKECKLKSVVSIHSSNLCRFSWSKPVLFFFSINYWVFFQFMSGENGGQSRPLCRHVATTKRSWSDGANQFRLAQVNFSQPYLITEEEGRGEKEEDLETDNTMARVQAF